MTLQYPESNINQPIGSQTVALPGPGTAEATTDASIILVDATNGIVTITLPFASDGSVMVITIEKIDAGGNAVSIAPQAGDTVNGTAGPLVAQFDSVTLINDAVTTWNVISSV